MSRPSSRSSRAGSAYGDTLTGVQLSLKLKNCKHLVDQGVYESKFASYVAVRIGDIGTSWEWKGDSADPEKMTTATSGTVTGAADPEYNELLELTVYGSKPEVAIRVYEKSEEDNLLGEVVLALGNDQENLVFPTTTLPLTGGTREGATITFGYSKLTEETRTAASKIQAVQRGKADRKMVEEKRKLLSSPPKPRPGETENWLDDYDEDKVAKHNISFGHGDSTEVRQRHHEYGENAGTAARAGKYNVQVADQVFKTLEEMIESNIKAHQDGFGARTLFGTHIHSILECFVAMDVDTDGVLSRREFSRALKRLGVGLPDKEVHVLFAQLDVNMNGSIEYGEFVRMFEHEQHDPVKLAKLKKEFVRTKKMSQKDQHQRDNHVRLIHYMDKKGGKAKVKRSNNEEEVMRGDQHTQREQMARSKFASFHMNDDSIEDEKFLTPDDDEFREALALLRKVPRKASDASKTVQPVAKNALNPWVVFVMGGPGSNAATLCAELARLRGFTYINAEDIIRQEIASSSALGRRMLQSISQGRVPVDATISIIMRAIMAASGTRVLVHGFPQDLEQAQTYEHAVGKCQAVLYVKCSRRLMQKRLLGAGGNFGNTEVDQTLSLQQVRKRILDYEDTVEPVLTYFQLSSKVHVIRDGPTVSKLVTACDNVLSSYATPNRTFGTQTDTGTDKKGDYSIGTDEFDNRVGKIEPKQSPFLPAGEYEETPRSGPNGETINFKRGGTPIQEGTTRYPVPPSGDPGKAGESPLRATRATLRSRHGDPVTESGPQAELARWFARIGIMAGVPDNWRREFSGGFLIAQTLEVYFPRKVQSAGFHTGSSSQYKRDNWRQLQQFFLANNHPLDDSEIKDLLSAKKGKIVPFLIKMHDFIARQGLVDPLRNKPPKIPAKGERRQEKDLVGDLPAIKSVKFGMDETNMTMAGTKSRRR